MKESYDASKDKEAESKSDEKPMKELSRSFRAGISSAQKLAERLGKLSLDKATPQDKEALRSELEDLKAVIEEKMNQLQ